MWKDGARKGHCERKECSLLILAYHLKAAALTLLFLPAQPFLFTLENERLNRLLLKQCVYNAVSNSYYTSARLIGGDQQRTRLLAPSGF